MEKLTTLEALLDNGEKIRVKRNDYSSVVSISESPRFRVSSVSLT